MAQRATSLGPKPSLFSFILFLFFVIRFFLCVFARRQLCDVASSGSRRKGASLQLASS